MKTRDYRLLEHNVPVDAIPTCWVDILCNMECSRRCWLASYCANEGVLTPLITYINTLPRLTVLKH